jgi:hypothetical protein
MTRPSPIAYPGSWYHAMNRGRRHEPAFLSSDDHLRFLHLLQEGWNDKCQRLKTRCDPFTLVSLCLSKQAYKS